VPTTMFIRIKKRKNKAGKVKAYAYLVSNKYRKMRKTPKQKVKAYLGRVYYFKETKKLTKALNLEKNFREIVQQMMARELEKRGFKQEGQMYQRESICVDLEKGEVYDVEKKTKVCIAINDGLMTNHTLQQIIEFKPPEGLEKDIGRALGNAMVSTGVPVDHETFIALFRKIIGSIGRASSTIV